MCLVMPLSLAVFAQEETRSTLSGLVLDAQGGAVVNATVVVRNADTGVKLTLRTNDTGYYEAVLLLPGNYELTAEMAGFKKLLRKGVVLAVASRISLDLHLEVGGVTETVSVTAETPLVETDAVTSGRVITNRTLMDLPVMGNNAVTQVRFTPGIQANGANLYLAPHSNIGGSDYNASGAPNSWTLDGAPNAGPSRRIAYLPYTDAVSEFKVETSNFDAQGVGGAAITMISKSGANDFHGTATWQHWQQRWQGRPFFAKKNYFQSIAAAEAAGNTTRANQLRNSEPIPPGRSHNWGASGGGPVIIPKVLHGRNKLFWFFSYNALKEVKGEEASTFNRTVPTANARNGDFREMLSLPNPAQYIVYDPLTSVRDPARPNNYVRTQFPDNIIPRSRFVNPAYAIINGFYPNQNNPQPAGQQPVNNYLAVGAPYNWDYKALSNRLDYQMSDNLRMFGRWSFNNFAPEQRGDWTYESAPGLNIGGLVRNNKGGNIDLVYTQSSSTVWDFNVALNQFREGNLRPKLYSFKPSDLGLPGYLDQRAGDLHVLPLMNVNGYTQISPSGYSTWTRYRIATFKAQVSHVRGNHTLRAAFDTRARFRTGGGGGNTSGEFVFSSLYTRKHDDTFAPSNNLGLGWAAFILGIPNSLTLATNDTFAYATPVYSGFVQDSWRLSPKLTLNVGLRIDYEQGSTERYNRMITGFDPTLTLPITAAAQTAYAANPIAELPAAQFSVLGGTLYAGTGGQPRNLIKNQATWQPRVGVAYQWNNKTVIRGGYGIYFDTLNVLNFSPDQFGFSRNTGTTVTNDFGASWNFPAAANPAQLKSPLVDPFPVRADGTRFDTPTREALGAMTRAGSGFGFTDFDQPRSRQQRWRFGVQRQFGANWVVEAAYAGSYADRLSIAKRLDILPEQYWANGTVRNDAIASRMNANVTNPFRLANFAALQQSNPLIYQDISTKGLFTSGTVRVNQLLRPFSHMFNNAAGTNLTDNTVPDGTARTHEFQLSLDKRFAKGFTMNFGYTAMKTTESNFYFNEFDALPGTRTSNTGRPHRVVGSAVFEFPFGRGKRFGAGANRAVDLLIGGWQTAATYEFTLGPLLDWGSDVFYYGSDIADINKVNRTFDTWFNTANFEINPNRGPNSYHRRVFPVRVPDLRADRTSQWNANMAKNIPITERTNLQLRLDVLNVQNRSQMQGPVTNPYNTNFGKVIAQTQGVNRWLQVQARLTF